MTTRQKLNALRDCLSEASTEFLDSIVAFVATSVSKERRQELGLDVFLKEQARKHRRANAIR